jgi:hypothetical protein
MPSLSSSVDTLGTAGVRGTQSKARRPVSMLFVQENGTISRANMRGGTERRRGTVEQLGQKVSADRDMQFIETKGAHQRASRHHHHHHHHHPHARAHTYILTQAQSHALNADGPLLGASVGHMRAC